MIEKGLQPATLRAYQRDMEDFIGINLSPSELERRLAELTQVGEWQAITVARKLSALRSFLRFLYDSGKVAEDWSDFWENPRYWRKIPTYLTPEEARQLLDLYPMDRRHSRRNKLLLELLYGAGLRVSEACQLRLADIDLNEEMLLVRGKGEKFRWVPFGKSIRLALSDYLPEREKAAPQALSTGFLLLSQKKGPLTRIQAYLIVREAARLTGLSRPISPHALRHSYATHLLLAGMDIAYLQRLLGHTNLTTTQHYLQILPGELAEVVRKFHPRAKEAPE